MAQKSVLLHSLLVLLGWVGILLPASEPSDTDEWFEREVRPLLAERCQSCHSSTLQAPKAGLQLDKLPLALAGGDSGPAIEPGKPEESLILLAVRGQGMNRMPPDKPLGQPEIATLERWIQLGAPWPQRQVSSSAVGPDWLKDRAQVHWAWQPMRDSLPPTIRNDQWPQRPLDSFVLSRLENAQLSPSGEAAQLQLLRRLAYDLTGLPPSVADWQRFEEHELAGGSAFEELYAATLERYLSSPEFGVTWGRHWFDLVRYCETLGHEFDYPVRHAWRYRDAVVDAFNDDLPYDQFVREQIAGDLVTPPRRHRTTGLNQSQALTGWWWMGEGLHAPVDVWGDEATRLDNQIDVYSKAFLGLTVACARCHDHKFDPISAADYTSLLGILQSSRRTYAFDDPHHHIANHNAQLAEQMRESISQALHSRTDTPDQATIQSWLKVMIQQWHMQPDEARKQLPIAHPLYPLLELAAGTPETFAAKHAATLSSLQAAHAAWQQWASESVLLADFRNGLPEGWYVEAADQQISQLATNPGPLMLMDPVGVLPARQQHFASHVLGHEQQLALRSPTFVVSHPMVALRMRGKAVQSTVVVDNYFMIEFHTLLFGDLKKSVDQPHDFGWVVHGGDLKKYLGHPAFLSIEDDDKGWFELSQVHLCHAPPPPEINPLALELTRRSNSVDDLVQRYAASLAVASATFHTPIDSPAMEMLRSAIAEARRCGAGVPAAVLPVLDRAPLAALSAATPTPSRCLSIHEGTPRDAVQFVRGNPHQRGEVVPRADLQALGGHLVSSPTSTGRAELAHWLTTADHPLTARVMVNRVWLQLFGQGLVDSPDNFGLLGGGPSNIELLDYLSRQFIAHDWSLKWLVREICSSRTYRLSSLPSAELQQSDPTSRLLSHRQVRRLSAEKLRDAMLALSGSLDHAQGGESIPVHLTDQMTGRGRPGKSGPLDGHGRRTVYVELRRNFLDPFLVAFDQPPPATTVGKRNASNVPAQALSLLNDPLVHELARRWSARVGASDLSNDQRIMAMYVAALSRRPTAEELQACRELIGDGQPARMEELAHVLMCTKEFQYVP